MCTRNPCGNARSLFYCKRARGLIVKFQFVGENTNAKEAAIAVRDWTFNNTPFNIVYSYMKYTNEPSAKTAISYGCKQVDEFSDEINGITKVFAISRDEWINL